MSNTIEKAMCIATHSRIYGQYVFNMCPFLNLIIMFTSPNSNKMEDVLQRYNKGKDKIARNLICYSITLLRTCLFNSLCSLISK